MDISSDLLLTSDDSSQFRQTKKKSKYLKKYIIQNISIKKHS